MVSDWLVFAALQGINMVGQSIFNRRAYKRAKRERKLMQENNVREAMAQREYDLPVNQLRRLREAGFLPSALNSPGSYGNVALNTSNDYTDPIGTVGDSFNMYNFLRQRKLDKINIQNENRRINVLEAQHEDQRQMMLHNMAQQRFNNEIAKKQIAIKEFETKVKHGVPLGADLATYSGKTDNGGFWKRSWDKYGKWLQLGIKAVK